MAASEGTIRFFPAKGQTAHAVGVASIGRWGLLTAEVLFRKLRAEPFGQASYDGAALCRRPVKDTLPRQRIVLARDSRFPDTAANIALTNVARLWFSRQSARPISARAAVAPKEHEKDPGRTVRRIGRRSS